MTLFLELREKCTDFFRQYESICKILIRFLVVFVDVLLINRYIGFSTLLSSGLFALIIGLVGALLPTGLAAALLALVVLAQLYAHSVVAAGMGLVLFLSLTLLYLRFSARDCWLLLAAPILFALRIPYLLPLLGGLLYTPMSILPISFAGIYMYFLWFMKEAGEGVNSTDVELVLEQIRAVVDGIAGNRELFVMLIAFAVSLVVVYLLRRRRFANAHLIALAAGAATQLIVVIAGEIALHAGIMIPGVFLGVLVSLALAVGFWLVRFQLDYQSIENVEFEDDEYYYYVRAIPKIKYRAPARTQRTINPARGESYPQAEPEVEEDDFGDVDYFED